VSAVLVIAGSDSSGGAGLTRDVHTLAHFGADSLCAVTAVTVQTNARVHAVHPVPPELIRAQIEAALATGRVGAIKVGMLGSRASVLAVAASLPPRSTTPLVLDPVLAASSGGELLDAAGREALCEALVPCATVLTPNIPEAAALLGVARAENEAQLLQQGEALLALGAEHVLLKGGHGSGADATDVLLTPGAVPRRFSTRRLTATRRGTGCALASALAAGLAAGLDVAAACARAKRYVTELLEQSD
jgi:hydroxymethylpyrimidine/phosphomethylpyrimidine kinase